METEVFVQQLKQFLDVQDQRALIYTRFNESFKEFLKTKNLWKYQQSIKSTTQTFAELSERMRGVKQSFVDSHTHSDVVELIDTLQSLESKKLKLTIHVQTLKKNQIVDNEDEYETDPEHVAEIKQNAKQEQQIVEEIIEVIREVREMLYNVEEEKE